MAPGLRRASNNRRTMAARRRKWKSWRSARKRTRVLLNKWQPRLGLQTGSRRSIQVDLLARHVLTTRSALMGPQILDKTPYLLLSVATAIWLWSMAIHQTPRQMVVRIVVSVALRISLSHTSARTRARLARATTWLLLMLATNKILPTIDTLVSTFNQTPITQT